MSCTCKNEDGTFSKACNGTCTQKEFIESSAVERSDQTIEERFENLISRFLSKLDIRLRNIENIAENIANDSWKEGYKEGLKEGVY